jgi:hypothetical protein
MERTKNADVKKFTQHMIDDHTKANTELKAVADKFQLAMPKPMTTEQTEMKARWEKMEGMAFDRDFTTAMMDSHKKSIDSFNNYAKTGKVAEVKDWVNKTLPALKHHLEMATDLNAKLSKGASLDVESRNMDVSYERENARVLNTSVDADASFETSGRLERTDRFERSNRVERVDRFDDGMNVSYERDGWYQNDNMRKFDVVYDNDFNATTTEKLNPDYSPCPGGCGDDHDCVDCD